MIYKLDIRDPKKTPFNWLHRVDALKDPRVFEFQPGLNILWGGNGSGKTTVISMLATMFHCRQGNQPVVTQTSLNELYGRNKDETMSGVLVEHDGQGVRHYNPSHTTGIMYGRIDDDFAHEGLLNLASEKASAGQDTVGRFTPIIWEVALGVVPKLRWTLSKGSVNGLYQDRLTRAEEFLKANREKGQPTILLDEPDRNLSLGTQINIWEFIRAYSDEVQIIVASHSIFALDIPDANYIEMLPASLKVAREDLARLKDWPNMKPRKLPKEKVEAFRESRANYQKKKAP